jgi:tetratricopeptide (TPR) repeat protein
MDIFFSKRHIPFILIIISFIVYLSTICPTVYLGDSGELTVAAFSLGIPHPSGYPLYALIGKLFCLIPIGSIGFRMNLMSVFFSLGTVWIVYSIINKITSSLISSVFGAFMLAFTPLFWLQTVSAEVYPLHTFFVALLISILIHWDEKRDLCYLALFAFIAGLSFLNHLQTIMLAPSVLFFLIISDRKGFLNLKTFIILSVLFLLALTVYIYLPIRTQTGAAIHWGDPDNMKNFFDVISGKNHRSEYVFNMTFMEYMIRGRDAFMIIIKQFWVILLFGVWGFIKLPLMRWKIFYLGIIIFDFFYTVFLNTVYIEITSFNLPTLIVIAILAGAGVSDLLKRCRGIFFKSNTRLYRISNIACCLVPVIFLASNYNICDQSRNYNGYEHALNIFRTINNGGIVIVGGDNNLFPITYARIVERMREDVILYDRYNLFFKMPYMDDTNGTFVYYGKWDDLLADLEKKVIERRSGYGVYYSLFNPHLISSVPEYYSLIPYGILTRVVNDRIEIDQKKRAQIWNYYAAESLEDNFYRDYMNREITAYYHYNKGKHLIMLGGIEPGLRRLKLASQIAYDDDLIHTELSLFLSDYGLFDEAKEELDRSLLYYQDLAGVYNNWGYYYSKRGDLANAVDSFNKAIDLDPKNILYHNNLGFVLLDAGRNDSAIEIFRNSLSINSKQERILKIVKEHDKKNEGK